MPQYSRLERLGLNRHKPEPMKNMTRLLLSLAIICLGGISASAQEEIPRLDPPPEPDSLPSDARILDVPTAPPSPFQPAVFSAPSAASNFEALQDDNTIFPPDTMGAVGPSNIVVMLNSQIRIQ